MFRRAGGGALRLVRSQRATSGAFIRTWRFISSEGAQVLKNEVDQENKVELMNQNDLADSVPWYLRDEESSKLDTPIFKAEMPEIPITCPENTQPIISYMIDKLGLDNFKVFDIRNLDDSEDIPISSLGDVMIIASGKSEKHLQNATQDLLSFLKNDFGIFPNVEGLMKPNSMIRIRRRMKKRMMNKKKLNEELFGVGVNSWIMIDTKINNIFIHLLTSERRELLNLEYLWCLPKDKELYLPKVYHNYEVNGREIFDVDASDSIFSGLKRRYSIDHKIPIDELVLRKVENKDFEINDDQLKIIKNDDEISFNILNGIIENLSNSTKSKFQEDETLLANLNELVLKIFPFEPTLKHWESRFEFYYYLQFLNDEIFRYREMTNTLLLQNSSGISITNDQFHKYVESITRSLSKSQPLKSEDLNTLITLQFESLFKILKIVEINNPKILNDNELVLNVLRIPTQQHLYSFVPNDYVLPIHGTFKTLIDLFYGDGVRRPNFETIEFILMTYLKANQVEEFWKFWDDLNKVPQNNNNGKFIIDDRPWDLLLNILSSNYKENFIEILFNSKLSFFVDLKLVKNEEIVQKINEILQKFDKNGNSYPDFREFFK